MRFFHGPWIAVLTESWLVLMQKCKMQVAECLACAAYRQALLMRNVEQDLAGEWTKATWLFSGECPTSQLAALP